MKQYLLTWYGLTDLRAALGLEATEGPILSALKTGKFTDVVILAYTNAGKDKNAFTDDFRFKWEKWKAAWNRSADSRNYCIDVRNAFVAAILCDGELTILNRE